MKYTGYTISFQEIPGEVSLAISISNCPFKCKECHSSYLQEDVGFTLTSEEFLRLLSNYKSPHTQKYNITCVVFFGGDQHQKEFIELAELSHSLDLKVCLYTGAELENVSKEIKSLCNYLKVGPYKSKLGALTSRTTNQRLYNLDTNTDITFKFWEI